MRENFYPDGLWPSSVWPCWSTAVATATPGSGGGGRFVSSSSIKSASKANPCNMREQTSEEKSWWIWRRIWRKTYRLRRPDRGSWFFNHHWDLQRGKNDKTFLVKRRSRKIDRENLNWGEKNLQTLEPIRHRTPGTGDPCRRLPGRRVCCSVPGRSPVYRARLEARGESTPPKSSLEKNRIKCNANIEMEWKDGNRRCRQQKFTGQIFFQMFLQIRPGGLRACSNRHSFALVVIRRWIDLDQMRPFMLRKITKKNKSEDFSRSTITTDDTQKPQKNPTKTYIVTNHQKPNAVRSTGFLLSGDLHL